MNILYFGDVVGKPGREALKLALPELRKEHTADLVLVNVENAAHGFGITPEVIDELTAAGVDLFSTGNHAWKNNLGVQLLEQEPINVVVPENYLEPLPGLGYTKIDVNGTSVLLMNLVGEVFMQGEIQSAFRTFDRIYEEHGREAVVLVDFHAEATGEKRVMGWYIDGRAALLVGTHTHVATADAQVLPEGTAYVTDLGMCGATVSSLGMDKELAVKKVAREMDLHLEPPIDPDEAQVNGVAVTIDEGTKRATAITRIDRVVRL